MDDDRFNVSEQSNTINDKNFKPVDSLTLIGDPINDETFLSPSTSTFRKSQRDCANKDHQAAIEVLNTIKERLQNSSSNSEKVLLLTLAHKS